MKEPTSLARSLRSFFSDYLPKLRAVSPHTIQSYRDGLALLLRFVASQQSRRASKLDFDNIGTEEVIDFLNHLEQERHNTPSTRNVRLAAIHAFFQYVAGQHPDRLEQSQRILGIPFKRTRTRAIEYLEYEEIEAVLAVVDRSSLDGRRDYTLIATMFNTGARVSEILGIRASDLQLEKPYHVRLFGKGRKERVCPLWVQTAKILRELCTERRIGDRSGELLFVNHRGEPLTRFGVRFILGKYFERAKAKAPSLKGKKLHPHSMRHSTAVHLLKAGVDLITISHWLGHASINTTNKYTAIDLAMKRDAIAQAKSLGEHARDVAPWRKDASILEWLDAL